MGEARRHLNDSVRYTPLRTMILMHELATAVRTAKTPSLAADLQERRLPWGVVSRLEAKMAFVLMLAGGAHNNRSPARPRSPFKPFLRHKSRQRRATTRATTAARAGVARVSGADGAAGARSTTTVTETAAGT